MSVNVTVYHSETTHVANIELNYEQALADIAFAVSAGDAIEATFDTGEPNVDHHTIIVTSDYGRRATYTFTRKFSSNLTS